MSIETIYQEAWEESARSAINSNFEQLDNYKVYTALLTQTGDGTTELTSGELEIGKRYEITTFEEGDNFKNVGALLNQTGQVFTATGTTPTSWEEESVLTDTSAPVATVLENTLGNIVWSRGGVGYYEGISVGLFTENKTFFYMAAFNHEVTTLASLAMNGSPNGIVIEQYDREFVSIDGLETKSVEIRVYP